MKTNSKRYDRKTSDRVRSKQGIKRDSKKEIQLSKEGIKDTNKIGREEIYVNNKSYINNEISYDEKQRVIKEGTREFTYTQEGYIKTDSKNSVSYEYDNLGNIVKRTKEEQSTHINILVIID